MELEKINCNICGANDFDIVYPSLYSEQDDVVKLFKSSGDEPSKDQIVKCKHCEFIYVNPRIKPEKIIEGYSEGSDERFVSQAKGREQTFERSLKFIEKYTQQKGKVLDIGTAGGSFLAVAQKHGWEVEGIEPNKWLCDWSKKNYGLRIKQGTLEKNDFDPVSFDLVTLWDVLEHVPDPCDTLTRINKLLKKEGLLVVNYPDIGSSVAKLMKRKWVFILTVHLFYFTPSTIKKILEKCGFEVVLIKKHWQKLALGYLATRFEPYSKTMHKIATKTVNVLGLDDVQFPYWLGQTFVIAKKVKDL